MAIRRESTDPRVAAGRSGKSIGVPAERQWLVLYDADCGLCSWLLAGLLRWDRGQRLRPIALQRLEAADLLPGLTADERMASWHLISPAGERHSAGAAVAPLLELLPHGRVPAACFARFPDLTEQGYRFVAEHRSGLSKAVPASAKRRAEGRVRARTFSPTLRG